MSDIEKIAEWLETLHCDRWQDDEDLCVKSNCQMFRSLAEDVRNGVWE